MAQPPVAGPRPPAVGTATPPPKRLRLQAAAPTWEATGRRRLRFSTTSMGAIMTPMASIGTRRAMRTAPTGSRSRPMGMGRARPPSSTRMTTRRRKRVRKRGEPVPSSQWMTKCRLGVTVTAPIQISGEIRAQGTTKTNKAGKTKPLTTQPDKQSSKQTNKQTNKHAHKRLEKKRFICIVRLWGRAFGRETWAGAKALCSLWSVMRARLPFPSLQRLCEPLSIQSHAPKAVIKELIPIGVQPFQ